MPGADVGTDLRVAMWQEPSGRWSARGETDPPIQVRASSKEGCLREVRRQALERSGHPGGGREPLVITVEVLPRLVGVAEAAGILGWDKRRVITYVDRGRFPDPVERLAGGRVWRRNDIEAYAVLWRSRRRQAGRAASGRSAARKAGTAKGRRSPSR